MKEILSQGIAETAVIASQWLNELANTCGSNDEAKIIGLKGHLGSGKTAFVKGIAREFGIKEEVTSPTFVIMKIYNIDSTDNSHKIWPWKRLIHIDAYRLERGEELSALDFENIISDKDNIVFVEWPEKVESILNTLNIYNISFSAPDLNNENVDNREEENKRKIVFEHKADSFK